VLFLCDQLDVRCGAIAPWSWKLWQLPSGRGKPPQQAGQGLPYCGQRSNLKSIRVDLVAESIRREDIRTGAVANAEWSVDFNKSPKPRVG
jgi:hypothetical protein